MSDESRGDAKPVEKTVERGGSRFMRRIVKTLMVACPVAVIYFVVGGTGLIEAAQCRHFGPCATMDAADFAYWKCTHIGPVNRRVFCSNPKWVVDVDVPCLYWREQAHKSCVAGVAQDCDYWTRKEAACNDAALAKHKP